MIYFYEYIRCPPWSLEIDSSLKLNTYETTTDNEDDDATVGGDNGKESDNGLS